MTSKAFGLAQLGNAFSDGALSNRNKIINGSMTIDQRNAGAAFNPPPNQGYSLDRWSTWLSQNTFSVQQNAGAVTPPAGFSKYLGVTVTSATTIGVSDYFGVGHKVEGYNIADLSWGTANAQAITLSLWVRSSLTGNFGAVIRRGDGGQYYAFLYAISSANTWEYKTVTIPGPTTGSWSDTNGTGLFLLFGLGAGANQTAGSNDTWVDGGVLGASGATPVVATNAATWQITGVQLEAGDTATPFEHRSYGAELALCQRYYYKKAFHIPCLPWVGVNNYNCGHMAEHPVTMRAFPTVVALTTATISSTLGSLPNATIGSQSASNITYESNLNWVLITNNESGSVVFGVFGSYQASSEL